MYGRQVSSSLCTKNSELFTLRGHVCLAIVKLPVSSDSGTDCKTDIFVAN